MFGSLEPFFLQQKYNFAPFWKAETKLYYIPPTNGQKKCPKITESLSKKIFSISHFQVSNFLSKLPLFDLDYKEALTRYDFDANEENLI